MKYFNWESRPKRPANESLPKLPGIKNEKEFAKRYGVSKNVKRSYLDAKAQYAGYKNYREWQGTRTKEKVTTKDVPRKPKPKTYKPPKPTEVYETGVLYVWEFSKQSKTGKTMPNSLAEKNISEINSFIPHMPRGKFLQIHVQGNRYGSVGGDSSPDEFPWWSSELFSVDEFIEEYFPMFGSNIHGFLVNSDKTFTQWQFPDDRFAECYERYSWRMHNKWIMGFNEIHFTIWDRPFENHRG